MSRVFETNTYLHCNFYNLQKYSLTPAAATGAYHSKGQNLKQLTKKNCKDLSRAILHVFYSTKQALSSSSRASKAWDKFQFLFERASEGSLSCDDLPAFNEGQVVTRGSQLVGRVAFCPLSCACYVRHSSLEYEFEEAS